VITDAMKKSSASTAQKSEYINCFTEDKKQIVLGDKTDNEPGK